METYFERKPKQTNKIHLIENQIKRFHFNVIDIDIKTTKLFSQKF